MGERRARGNLAAAGSRPQRRGLLSPPNSCLPNKSKRITTNTITHLPLSLLAHISVLSPTTSPEKHNTSLLSVQQPAQTPEDTSKKHQQFSQVSLGAER